MTRRLNVVCSALCIGVAVASYGFNADADLLTASANNSSISGSLYGNYSSGVLQLDASFGESGLVIDTSGIQGNRSPFVLPVVNTVLPCGISNSIPNCVTVKATPQNNSSSSLSVPAWGFDLSGSIDFNKLTANLVLEKAIDQAKLVKLVILRDVSAGKLVFNVVANTQLGGAALLTAQAFAKSLQSTLDTYTTTFTSQVSGDWSTLQSKLLATPTGLSISKLAAGSKVDFGVSGLAADLLGEITGSAGVTFSPEVISLVGSGFAKELETAFTTRLMNLAGTFVDGLDTVQNGFAQACSGSATSSSIGISCNVSAKDLSFSGTLLSSATQAVPEPRALLIFTVGLVCLGLMQRRRPA